MPQHSAEERLIAAATDLGLRKSVVLLQEQFVKSISQILLQSPVESLSSKIQEVLGLGEMTSQPRQRQPRRRLVRRAPRVSTSAPQGPEGTLLGSGFATINTDGDFMVMHLPDGRVWRSKRRRDLVLRAKRAGFTTP